MEINMKNYDYLKNQVKYTGFGEGFDEELKSKMAQQPKQFTLSHSTKFGNDEVNSTLNFEKSKTGEVYFFNSYEMAMKQAHSEDTLKQTFYIGKENNITLKERYNLLNGRAVFKEFNKLEKVGEGESARFKPTDEIYKSWAVTNFKESDAQGNFLTRKVFWDHEKALAKFPVKELEDAYDKARLTASLEKGNLQKATVVQDGREVKVAIAANPLNKTFDFYDGNMVRMEVKPVQSQNQSIGENATQVESVKIQQDKKAEKQTAAEESKQGKSEKAKHRVRVS